MLLDTSFDHVLSDSFLPALQVKKSEKNLLERLFNVIHHLTPVQMENLLREEDSVVQRRFQARRALNDVKSALYIVSP